MYWRKSCNISTKYFNQEIRLATLLICCATSRRNKKENICTYFHSLIEKKLYLCQLQLSELYYITRSFLTFCCALCTIFTILLTLWNSDQKNGLLIKLFCFSSDIDEKQKVLLIACFSDQNFKVSVESWNSYIVRTYIICIILKKLRCLLLSPHDKVVKQAVALHQVVPYSLSQ